MPGTSGGLQGYIALLAVSWGWNSSGSSMGKVAKTRQVYNRHLWNIARAERFAQAFQVKTTGKPWENPWENHGEVRQVYISDVRSREKCDEKFGR
jgi:hypothetical protein